MKSALFLIVMLILHTPCTFSQRVVHDNSISVLSVPVAGQVCYPGESIQIPILEHIGNHHYRVNIWSNSTKTWQLLSAGFEYSSEKYTWNIPSIMPIGKYRVMVESIDGSNIKALSVGLFTVVHEVPLSKSTQRNLDRLTTETNFQLQCYPIPAVNDLHVSVTGTFEKIMIYSVETGNVLAETIVESGHITFNLQRYQPGAYMIVGYRSGMIVATKMFIKNC